MLNLPCYLLCLEINQDLCKDHSLVDSEDNMGCFFISLNIIFQNDHSSSSREAEDPTGESERLPHKVS